MSDVPDQDLNDILSQNPVFYTTKQENDVETCIKCSFMTNGAL